MASDQEVYKILMQIEGEEKLRAAQAAAAAYEKQIIDLNAQLRAGAITATQHGAAVKVSAAGLVDANRQAAEFSRGTRNGGRALLEFSRAAEDAQYGIAGVLNNIPGFIQALGGGSGLTAVVSLLAVGIAQLVKHWGELTGLLGSGHVRTAAEEMEALRKKTSLTADEAERLARADALKGKVKELRGAQTDEQKKTADGVTKAITEVEQKNVVAGLLHTNPGAVDGHGDTAAASKELAEAQQLLDRLKAKANTGKGINDQDVEKQRAVVLEAQRKMNEARRKTAEEMIASGALPEFFGGNLDRLIGHVEKDPAAFAGGDKQKGAKFLQGLRDSTPAARKAKEDREAAEAAGDASFDDNIARGKKRKADARKVSDDLQAGPLGSLAEDGKLSDAAVRRAMKRDGRSQADIDRLAGTVGDQLRRGGAGRVRDYADERGISPAEARRRMGKERGDKEAKDLGLDGPGLIDKHANVREAASAMVAAHLRGGADLDTATAQTYRSVFLSQGQAAARGSIAGARLEGQRQFEASKPIRASQVIDSASVADAVQAGVGGQRDDVKQSLAELRKQSQSLTRIAENTAKRNALVLAR